MEINNGRGPTAILSEIAQFQSLGGIFLSWMTIQGIFCNLHKILCKYHKQFTTKKSMCDAEQNQNGCNNEIAEHKIKRQITQELAPRLAWSQHQARENKTRSPHQQLARVNTKPLEKIQEKCYKSMTLVSKGVQQHT